MEKRKEKKCGNIGNAVKRGRNLAKNTSCGRTGVIMTAGKLNKRCDYRDDKQNCGDKEQKNAPCAPTYHKYTSLQNLYIIIIAQIRHKVNRFELVE